MSGIGKANLKLLNTIRTCRTRFCSQFFHLDKVIAVPFINLLEQILHLEVPFALQDSQLDRNRQRDTNLLRSIKDQITLLLNGL